MTDEEKSLLEVVQDTHPSPVIVNPTCVPVWEAARMLDARGLVRLRACMVTLPENTRPKPDAVDRAWAAFFASAATRAALARAK
jgi:hypothetical protein